MQVQLRFSKHKRNRSEPIPAQQQAPETTTAFSSENEIVQHLPSHAGKTAYRWQSLGASKTLASDWTERSSKMFAIALGSLLLLLCTTNMSYWGSGANVPSQQEPKLHSRILLHQTVRSFHDVTTSELEWRHSWEVLGFVVRLANDSRCREDLQSLVAQTGNTHYLAVYDALETGVQRSDMWRYTALYLYGGVYADKDVEAKPPMATLLNSLSRDLNRSGVVFVESLPSPWLVGFIARFLYVTDMVRLPQFRNCVMISCKGHPVMRATLDAIVAKFKAPSAFRPSEPTHTLELTGPGIFTDAIKSIASEGLLDAIKIQSSSVSRGSTGEDGQGGNISSDHRTADGEVGGKRTDPGASGVIRRSIPLHRLQSSDAGSSGMVSAQANLALPLLHISRLAGHRYFRHVGQGSWKSYRRYSARKADFGLLLDPHEIRVLLLLLLLTLASLAGLHYATRRHHWRACLLSWRRNAQRLRAAVSYHPSTLSRRSMAIRFHIQAMSVIIVLSGIRAQTGARCLNPWCVVGYWMYTVEHRLMQRVEASRPVGKTAPKSPSSLPSLQEISTHAPVNATATSEARFVQATMEELEAVMNVSTTQQLRKLVIGSTVHGNSRRRLRSESRHHPATEMWSGQGQTRRQEHALLDSRDGAEVWNGERVPAWVVPSPPAPLPSLAVISSGIARGAAIMRAGTIDAVQEVSLYFMLQSIHLFLVIQSSGSSNDNTRQVIMAWAIRNPAVRIHALQILPANATDATLRVSLAALRRSAVHLINIFEPEISHVLLIDLQTPQAFSAPALAAALSWAAEWDAVCAAKIESDGVVEILPHLEYKRSQTVPLLVADTSHGRGSGTATAAAPIARQVGASSAFRVRSCPSGVVLYHRAALQACNRKTGSNGSDADSGNGGNSTAHSGGNGTVHAHLPPLTLLSPRRRRRLGIMVQQQRTDSKSFYHTAEAFAASARPDEDAAVRQQCEHVGCGGLASPDERPLASGKGEYGGGKVVGTEVGDDGLHNGRARLYVLPALGVRQYTLHEDLQYIALTVALMLPTFAGCSYFLFHGLAACFLRHKALLLLLLLLILAAQIAVMHIQLSASCSISFLLRAVPLALPLASAIDLMTSRRHGDLSLRFPLAILTVAPPVIMLLELRRLRTSNRMPPHGTGWLDRMELCSSARACGAPTVWLAVPE